MAALDDNDVDISAPVSDSHPKRLKSLLISKARIDSAFPSFKPNTQREADDESSSPSSPSLIESLEDRDHTVAYTSALDTLLDRIGAPDGLRTAGRDPKNSTCYTPRLKPKGARPLSLPPLRVQRTSSAAAVVDVVTAPFPSRRSSFIPSRLRAEIRKSLPASMHEPIPLKHDVGFTRSSHIHFKSPPESPFMDTSKRNLSPIATTPSLTSELSRKSTPPSSSLGMAPLTPSMYSQKDDLISLGSLDQRGGLPRSAHDVDPRYVQWDDTGFLVPEREHLKKWRGTLGAGLDENPVNETSLRRQNTQTVHDLLSQRLR